MKRKVLLTSILTIVLCLCLISGSTYALFTDSSSVKVVASSAMVNVDAHITGFAAKSMTTDRQPNADGSYTFANGGTVKLVGSELQIENMCPGDSVTVTVYVSNSSNILTNCSVNTTYSSTGSTSLASALVISGDTVSAVSSGESRAFTFTITLPEETGNDYQGKNTTVTITVSATQANS